MKVNFLKMIIVSIALSVITYIWYSIVVKKYKYNSDYDHELFIQIVSITEKTHPERVPKISLRSSIIYVLSADRRVNVILRKDGLIGWEPYDAKQPEK